MKNYFIFLVFAFSSTLSGCKKPLPPPNIIVFLADDLGYGDLGCSGNPIIQTANIDQLAKQGVRMTDFYSGGKVCSPSRAALLTGRNLYRTGIFYLAGGGIHLQNEEITIAELLHDKGYETGFWGKWHLSVLEKGKVDEPGPGDQGFDYWMGTTLNAFGGPKNQKKFILNGKPVGETEGWYCDVMVNEACNWLKNIRNKEKPFFMYMCPHEPHTPIGPPEEYSGKYDIAEVDSLENQLKYGGVPRPAKDISDHKKEYYGTVSQLDAAFGRLMGMLDSLKLADHTIVVFTSDNGPESPVSNEESLGQWEEPIPDKCFGTPGNLRGMKRFPWERGHRVPGIVRFPGVIPAGTESSLLFNGSDLLPTLCALAGAKVPTDRPIDGVNAFGAFLGESVQRTESPIWFYPNHEDTYFRMPQMSMRKDNYTLIGWLPGKADTAGITAWMATNDPQRFELYDVKNDPSQSHEISDQHPEMVAALKKEMIILWREMRNEGLEKTRYLGVKKDSDLNILHLLKVKRKERYLRC